MLVIGIIGAGSISECHIEPYLNNGNCRIKAIADLNLDIAKAKAEKYGIENAYADYKEILNDKEIDAVSIVTPTFTHCNIVKEALEAGKNILCEKPPALNAEQTRECAKLAEKSGKLLMYAFVCRFRSHMQYMKQYMDAGKMGKVVSAEAVRMHLCDKTGGWFLNKSRSGGGPLIDANIHEIDSILYLMGYPKVKMVVGCTSQVNSDLPSKVKGIINNGWVSSDVNTYDRTVENVASGYVVFENGAYLFIKTSTVMNVVKEETYMEICGEKAGVRMEPLVPGSELKMVEVTDDNYIREVKPVIENVQVYQEQVNHFVDCCINGTECICKNDEAVKLMEIIDAIYKSAETGKPIMF